MSDTERQAKLDRSRAIRRANRGVLTKLIKEVDDILKSELNDEVTSRLRVIVEQLEGKAKLFSSLDSEILGLCPLEDIERETEESEEVTAKALELKRRVNAAISPVAAVSPAPSVFSTPPTVESAASTKPRLPKLTLSKFRGDVTQWSAFWDSYRSAIHENSSVAIVDKFNYLYSLLEGPAARTIQGLALNESNYEAAINLLQDRFGDPQQIISAHMDELYKIPPCVGEKSSSLRYVYDRINVNVRGLSSMGITSAQYGSMLIPIIMDKLSSELRLRIARESKRKVWEIGELLAIIKAEVEAREASELVRIHAMRPQGGTPNRMNSSRSNATASALVTQHSSVRCVYCNESHYSASCQRVSNCQERKDILLRSGRCFNCLKTSHKSRDCDSRKTCRHCHRKHHQSICSQIGSRESNTPIQTPSQVEVSQPPDGVTSVSNTTSTTSRCKNQPTVLLQTARATAFSNADGSGVGVSVRVLFDSGSQLSYVTERLQARLKLPPIKIERLHLNTFGSRHYKTQECHVVKLYLQGSAQGETISVSALTSPAICSPLPAAVQVEKYPHLSKLELADNYNGNGGEIDVLIGSNCYWNIVTGETTRGDHGPVAVNSKLGWLLSGTVDTIESRLISHTYLVISGSPANPVQREDDVLVNSLQRFWEVESMGIMDPGSYRSGSETFLPSLSLENGRYEVGLPWKHTHCEIPDHLSLCEGRLRSLIRRLRSNPNMLLEYDKIIKDQLRQGIVERVEGLSNQGNFHYLPHHGVVRQDSETTKLRVVYDGSARAIGDDYSLNDCLLTGPNCIPRLFNILVQFRWDRIAVTADIEKAFLMISIKPSDRDFLRFLWIENPGNPQSEVAHLRFTRLVFGLRPSPAVLGSVIEHHISQYQDGNSGLINKLRNSLYVDDLVTSTSDPESAYQFYVQCKGIMSEGGMNLRKWHSNSSVLLERIRSNPGEASSRSTLTPNGVVEEDDSYVKTMMGPSVPKPSRELTKVLGVLWNSLLDVFTFEFDGLLQYASTLLVNKRSILKLSAKIFDPLGLVSPFVIQLKILFQVLCVQQVDWDEQLSGESLVKWKSILSELHCLNGIQVPRCYFLEGHSCTVSQLHGFCDASDRAFAAVVYLRTVYSDGSIHTVLIASKTRVAPVKKQSIPRLELLGAVTLSRLVASILTALPEDVPAFYWTDSTATLHWIRNDRPWKQYIEHRVSEIRQLTVSQQWRHCPGNLNPADIPSRGMNGGKLATSESWWRGPAFLHFLEDKWPDTVFIPSNEVIDAELVKKPAITTHILLASQCTKSPPMLDEVIDSSRFSKLDKLLCVTAYVLRFIKLLRSHHGERRLQHTANGKGMQLSVDEIYDAEVLWIQSIQAKLFTAEMKFLQSSGKHSPPIRVHQFGLFLDSGLLRCRGRVNNSLLTQANKNPVLLPSNHPWVNLLVLKVHQQVQHSGTADTLSTIREKYWILRGRQVVKRVIRSCVTCIKVEGLPYASTVPPDLPDFRVSEDPPFAHTGIDFAGPLYVVEPSSQESSMSKAYVCLFTCCSTRAVHLELTPDMSVPSFLLLFRRFASRRGLPVTLVSDNAKTFKATSKDIEKIARSVEVVKFLNSRRVSWKFIVEKAPWWGGFWERLVRSVKRCLKKTMGKSNLSYEELGTILTEVETVINSRPLTYVSDDQDGISSVLTPSHLINGRRITTMPNGQYFEVVSTYESLTKKAKHHRHLLTQFTKQWRKDYLLNLRENHSVKMRQGKRPAIEKGDVVIVKDEGTKRLFWKLAIVTDLITGADNQSRAAVVKVSDPQGKVSLLRRSIKHLYPIEVNK